MRHLLLLSGLAALAASAVQASPAGNANRGGVLFQQRCQACHTADRNGRNGVGPGLFGVYGRRSGQAVGYAYSQALRKPGVVWTDARLDAWFVKPNNVAKGTKMFMAPISQAQDRRDLVAFLKSRATALSAAGGVRKGAD